MRADNLKGKVVLITGGSRGLGLALAREFAAQGCHLALCARDDLELTRARVDLEKLGAQVMTERCNVADRNQVESFVGKVIGRFERIDLVVNNAGVIQVGPFESMTVIDFGQAMNINFWGPLNVIWAVLPHLREQGSGHIVNVTSIGGKIAVPHLMPYDCAKAAFISLSEGLQAELAKDGIAVTTVVPGLMRTGSPVNAVFKGDAEREFGWFSLGDSSLVTSTSAEHAARRIVRAARQRKGEVVITWQAKLARLLHGVFPNTVIRMLERVNRLMPASGPDDSIRGSRGRELNRPPMSERMTRNVDEAEARLNQLGGDGTGLEPSDRWQWPARPEPERVAPVSGRRARADR